MDGRFGTERALGAAFHSSEEAIESGDIRLALKFLNSQTKLWA